MNFNRIILAGNLTRDPVLSYLPSQMAVIDFGIAVNRKWKGKDGQERNEVCFVDCKAFGRTAENINKYCFKGDPLLIEGRLCLDSWTTEGGAKRYKHYVILDSFQFLGTGEQRAPQSNGTEQDHSDDETEF